MSSTSGLWSSKSASLLSNQLVSITESTLKAGGTLHTADKFIADQDTGPADFFLVKHVLLRSAPFRLRRLEMGAFPPALQPRIPHG